MDIEDGVALSDRADMAVTGQIELMIRLHGRLNDWLLDSVSWLLRFDFLIALWIAEGSVKVP